MIAIGISNRSLELSTGKMWERSPTMKKPVDPLRRGGASEEVVFCTFAPRTWEPQHWMRETYVETN
jgi:hypothetical protein